MPICSVSNCKNYQRTRNSGISYHRFPHDPVLAGIWQESCSNPNIRNIRNSRICSAHFHPSCYEPDFRSVIMELGKCQRRLREGAIPTLNLPGNSPASSFANADSSIQDLNETSELQESYILPGDCPDLKLPSTNAPQNKENKLTTEKREFTVPTANILENTPMSSPRNTESVQYLNESSALNETFILPGDDLDFQVPCMNAHVKIKEEKEEVATVKKEF